MLVMEPLKACNFIKKWLQDRCFPVNFAKFLRTPFFFCDIIDYNCTRQKINKKYLTKR